LNFTVHDGCCSSAGYYRDAQNGCQANLPFFHAVR
jgi:hypothetical protein